ncbi:sigma factor-like helix-turn-helix DNA-binding protein [Nocardia sp. NPDC004604]|uniref:sigma factor-like helix-turn-helix DNA-binding protein n=1 Tax=Nocardia sp. NPDC004604 TaxID=3157013 RepID=UPI0033B9EDBB
MPTIRSVQDWRSRWIDALPLDQRQVLITRDIPGSSGPVVADALGLSLAATKSRLHRAALRENLA